jgi:UDP-perosamine 4-acetyltransferase
MKMDKPCIVIGAGGHAKSVCDALLSKNLEVLGCTDNTLVKGTEVLQGIKTIGADKVLSDYTPDQVYLANGVGSIKDIVVRKTLMMSLQDRGYKFPPIIHRTAYVAEGTELGSGCVVLAGGVIQPGVRLGENVIVNTRASIDHDCFIRSHSHIAPGAILCGSVSIGEEVHIGAGAIILQGVKIVSGAIIPAGLTIRKSVKVSGIYDAAA